MEIFSMHLILCAFKPCRPSCLKLQSPEYVHLYAEIKKKEGVFTTFFFFSIYGCQMWEVASTRIL